MADSQMAEELYVCVDRPMYIIKVRDVPSATKNTGQEYHVQTWPKQFHSTIALAYPKAPN